HPGIGAAGDGGAHSVGASDAGEGVLQSLLHRAQSGLGRPAREVGAVIRKDETGPHDLFSHGARLVSVKSQSYLADSSSAPSAGAAADSAVSSTSSVTSSAP